MDRVPVLDSIESRSIEKDETLRFERLERVRARQRARRRQRLILVTVLTTTLADIGILGFTKRHTVSTAVGNPAAVTPTFTIAPAPSGDGELNRDAAPPPRLPDAAPPLRLPAAAAPPPRLPAVALPPRPPADAAPPPRLPAVAPPAPHSPAPPAGRSDGATVPSRAEPRDAEAGDSTAAIDWLLKTSRTGSH
jgi:hypothetical protein